MASATSSTQKDSPSPTFKKGELTRLTGRVFSAMSVASVFASVACVLPQIGVAVPMTPDPASGLSWGLIFGGAVGAIGLGWGASALNKKARRTVINSSRDSLNRMAREYRKTQSHLKAKYLDDLPGRLRQGWHVPIKDLGILVLMKDKDIEILPAWAQAETFKARRDLAAWLMQQGGEPLPRGMSLGDDARYKTLSYEEQAAIYKKQSKKLEKSTQYRDYSSRHHHRDDYHYSYDFADGLFWGWMFGRSSSDSSGDMDSDSAKVLLIIVAAAAIIGAFYCSGRSVYDNYIKKFPELKEYKKPILELPSAEKDLIEARGLQSSPVMQSATEKTPKTLSL